MKKNEHGLRDLSDIIKHTNLCIMRVSEGKKREKGAKRIFKEIMA